MSTISRRRGKPIEEPPLIQNPEDSEKDDPSLLSSSHWLAIFLIYSTVVLGSIYLHKCLPTPLEPNKENSQFSEVRAIKILEELSNFGWKPAGSHNCEELTRNRILKELQLIKSNAAGDVRFDIDTQYVNGCFDIPAHDTEGMNICYKNVSNVIARLGQTPKHDSIAVLLNCHYDSWPTSSAGSDDLSSCALMLELIRIYSSHPNLLKHDVIFLFNGAEESSLLAAHGFITQHRWRHDIRAFINLEASGSGGRELLFQAGPANEWLLNSYLEAAVHPHCSVLGQEVFQSGVYPGDTDFRVFRDHGRVPGLDLAFVQNGYWWHTEFDEAFRIASGSLQRAGENVLSTLNHLLASPYLEKPAEYADRKTVFFDFLGLFVVIYPLSIAHLINITVILLVFYLAFKSYRTYSSIFLIAARDYILVCASMTTVIYCMIQMSLFNYGALRWYTRHWLATVAYGLPCVWTGLSVQGLLAARVPVKARKEYARSLEIQHLVVISLILFVFTYYNIASGFLFALQLLPVIKMQLVDFGPNLNVLSTVLLSLPGCSMCIYTAEMLLSIFIPIMGRTSGNPEPIVATFVGFAGFAIVLSLMGLAARTKNSRSPEESSVLNLIYTLAGVILSTLTILYVFSCVWPSPYNFDVQYPTTKRTQFFHVNQLLYTREVEVSVNETRFYAISHDYRGADDIPFVYADDNYTVLHCHYNNNPYCEVPYLFPTRNRIKERHIRVRPVEERLKFPFETRLESKLKKRAEIGGAASIEYSLSVIGTGQISVYLIPDDGWTVASTSVAVPSTPQHHMFLYFTCSAPGNRCQWDFDIVIKKMDNRVSDEKPLLVGVSSHYLHGEHMQSKSIRNMIQKIHENRVKSPSWAITASAWNVDQIYKYF
ncbi:unnamed protein product [Caenorhabditis bovis]|uniref:FXNA-like protease n=1 Tax=Caenorhabditis bovis TaxID=2654633 RepID=A0A8S1EYJ7_9PELO|nr:unnamed protein product [Caenorhabditis bovis]